MPNRGLVAESIMRQAHNNSGHAGINYTMRLVTQKFWIAKPTKLYNHVRTTCFMCRFFANKLWQIQEGLLPSNKIVPTKPFQFIGIDIAGPLFLKTPDIYKLVMNKTKAGKEALKAADPEGKLKDNPFSRKYYVLLMVCATTRAVDFQIMEDATAESIIPAYQTFCSSRGIVPSYVLSDNATDFERTNNILQQAIRETLSSTYSSTKWVFIPSRAPWWGGQYEIFVRLLKKYLWNNMPNMSVKNALQAQQFVKAAEGVINSRPLYALPSGINDIVVTTPNSFINVSFDLEEKYFPINIELPLKAYQLLKVHQSKQLRELWKKFHEEYLTEMRQFHCRNGCFSKRPIKVGDIVLIKKERVAKNFWPLAKVSKVIVSPRDGYIRTVMVQHYLPFSINEALRKSKYANKANEFLTKEQIRDLTGYFEKMRHTQVVNNLVPYELWRGDQAEPEDMDTGQVSEIEVSFGNTKMKGSKVAFYAMSKDRQPVSQIHRFDELPTDFPKREEAKWTTTSSLDLDYHEEVLSSWNTEGEITASILNIG
jgi:hypothetical protein